MVSWKAESAPGRQLEFGVLGFGRPAARKWCPKGALFENSENRKGHHKPTFHTSLALGPSKNGPQERLGKNIKRQWGIDRKVIDRGMRKNSLALASMRNSHFRRFSRRMKVYGKIDPKSHCRRKAWTPHPWGTSESRCMVSQWDRIVVGVEAAERMQHLPGRSQWERKVSGKGTQRELKPFPNRSQTKEK